MQSWKNSSGESIRDVRTRQEQKGQVTFLLLLQQVVSGSERRSSTCRDLERQLSMNLETRQQFAIPWMLREQGLMAQGSRWVWPGLLGAGKLVFIHGERSCGSASFIGGVTSVWERRRAF